MWWNNVETKPYGGYPHHWDVKMLDLLEQANPGGQNWDGKAEGPESALRQVQRQDHLRSGQNERQPRRRAKARSATCPPTKNGPRPTATRTTPSAPRKA